MLDRRLFILYFGAALGPLGGNAVLALIPTFKDVFSIDAGTAALSITFFMVPFTIVQLFSGPVSDLYDRQRAALFGFILYAIGSGLCALSPDINFFLASRVVQGLGFAWINPIIVALMGDITTVEDRGKAMGFLGAAVTAGIASGPLVGGFLADVWRLAFLLFLVLSLLTGAVFWWFFREHTSTGKKGALRDILPHLGHGLSNSNVVLLCAAGFLVFFSYMGVITFLSDAISLPPLSLESWEIGMVLACSGLGGIMLSPLAGVAVDRIGRKKTAMVGLTLMVLALFALRFGFSFITFALLLFVLGCGTAFVWAAFNTLSVEILPDDRGTVSSLFNSFRFFGYAMSPMALAPVYSLLGMNFVYVAGMASALMCIALVYFIRDVS